MSNKYLTVAEFAASANITRQAVYDQMKQGKRLYPYVKKINGKKKIKAEALAYYTNTGEAPEPEPEPEKDDSMLKLLTEQLAVKDKQIDSLSASLAAKDEQIKDLSETIRANMTMLYALQNQVARLTGESAQDEQAPAAGNPIEQDSAPVAGSAAPEPVTRSKMPAAETTTPEKRVGGFFAWLSRFIRE